MIDLAKMFDTAEVVIVASDPDLNIVYTNAKAKKFYKELRNKENLVGRSLIECHNPASVDKIRKMFQEFRNKEKALDYYLKDFFAGTTWTVVQVPFYDSGDLAGVIEFIFESTLD